MMNLRFLYFSVCLQSVQFFSKFSCHGNTHLTVLSISEFSDPKHPLNTNSEGILHRTEVMSIFGCHGNAVCFIENSDSIRLFADPKKIYY